MKFSSRMNSLQDEALLNAFENIENKDMISFSAGFPSQETYPVEGGNLRYSCKTHPL